MVMKIVDMVAMAGTVTGTDDVALGAALAGFRTLAAAGIADGEEFPYRLASADGSVWETGVGAYYEITGAPYFTRYAHGSYVTFGTAVACELYVAAPSWMHTAVNVSSGATGEKAAPQANQPLAVAVGGGAVAGGYGAVAGGCKASASGDRSIAIGFESVASSEASTAIGRGTAVAGCAALARGSKQINTDYSGALIWTGFSDTSGTALDVSNSRFTLPNVKCIALLDVLIVGANTAFSDSYAARASVVVKRTAVNGTIAIEGTPSVTVIKDDTGAAAPAFTVFSTGADSALNIAMGVTMNWNATVVATLVQV